MNRNHIACGLYLLLAGCGRDLTPSDIKTVGVGLTPDEIGPEAEPYGGLVELDWVDFAGGQLPVALAGLASYSPVGPGLSTFKAPYAMVLGLGFIMLSDLEAPDVQLGNFASPPRAPGTCQTVYEPVGFVNNLADVGQEIRFKSDDGAVSVALSRTPEIYPPDARDVFSYYFGVQGWRPDALSRLVPGASSSALGDMTREVYQPTNFGFGQTVSMSFPGGVPPETATVGSIPVPLASAGSDVTLTLPAQPKGVHMSWVGPVFDANGQVVTDGAATATCLEYQGRAEQPADPTDCADLAVFPDTLLGAEGQMYTGPWDTDGGVLFQWVPPAEGAGDTVSVTVRFLKAVDPSSEEFRTGVVLADADAAGESDWAAAIEAGDVPAGAVIPKGQRAPEACEDEDDVSWIADPSLFSSDGTPVPSLQGDPQAMIVETTCTVSEQVNPDTGFAEFLLTEDMLADALAYATARDGGGAIFYFSRSSSAAIATPAARDDYGKRRDISPVLVVSRAVQLGRFWYDL